MISIRPEIGPPNGPKRHQEDKETPCYGFLVCRNPNNPMFDYRNKRERRGAVLPTFRCLLPLRLIHNIEIGAEQPIKKGTYWKSQVDGRTFGTFEEIIL